MKSLFRKNFISGFTAAFLFLLSSFLLFFVPLTVNTTVWKNYRILFLPMDTDENEILNEMHSQGIYGAVSSETIEKRFSEFEEKDMSGYPFTLKELYSQWFLNDQENLRYIYIPSSNKVGLKFLYFLKNNTEGFYLEDSSVFSFFQFAGALIFFAVCIYFSGRKFMFCLLGLPIVIFAGFEKGILSFTAALFFLHAEVCWIEAVFANLKLGKEQIKRRIKKNSIIVFIPIFSLAVLSFNSDPALIVFLFAFISGVSLLYIAENTRYLWEKKKDTERLHKVIAPYVMNPESIEKIWPDKKLFVLASSMTAILGIFSFVLFMGASTPPEGFGSITYLPLPQGYVPANDFSASSFDMLKEIRHGDALPDLGNYICDRWFETAMPYLNAAEPIVQPESGSVVEFSDFTEDENGKFYEDKQTILTFNDKFIKDILSFRNELSIEDMLCRQNCFITASYGGKEFPVKRYGKAAFAISIFSLLLPLTLMLLRVLKK